MCGIAGIIQWGSDVPVERDILHQMSAAIAHRGPDGQGLCFDHDSRCAAGLAHRRLAVLDPNPRSNQPFELDLPDGRRFVLVFNGEIYNFRNLRAELEQDLPGYAWRTGGDTEVLAAAYAAWGVECLARLEGMFAFAIWDRREHWLFLARDRMGQKPLYLAASERACAFASEPRALRPVPWIDWSLREEGLAEYLRYGYATHTIFNGVTQLEPGTYRLLGPDNIGPARRYFDPNEINEPRAIHEPRASASGDVASTAPLRSRLVDIVGRQLVSDVPLGCFLSGGIDSSIIAACARAHGPLQTFSIGFDDPRYDETPYARAVARHLGTDHHELRVTIDAAQDLPKLAGALGEPFGDSSFLPTYYLSRETRRHVTVALSGDGGDELFGGYERYRAMQLGRRLDALPTSIRRLLSSVGRAMPDDHPKSAVAKLKRFLSAADRPPAGRYLSLMRLFDDALLHEIRGHDSFSPDPLIDSFNQLAHSRDVVAAAAALDRISYLPGDLLTKVDRASMLFALEIRCPFMDHGLVGWAAQLDADQLLAGGRSGDPARPVSSDGRGRTPYSGGKRMLREAFAADLPAWVFHRPKMGFAVPIGQWFRHGLKSMLHDHLLAADSFAADHFNLHPIRRLLAEHHSGRQDHTQRLYALLMLELWWRSTRD